MLESSSDRSKSFSDAKTSNEERDSSAREVRRQFFMIFTLLSARSADALDTGKQQKIEYSIVKFGKPDNWRRTRYGFRNVPLSHCLTEMFV